MPKAGDIYFCQKIQGDLTSDHCWVLLYVSVNEVLYVTATSQVDRFVYKIPVARIGQHIHIPEPARHAHPSSAVFLAVRDVVDGNGRQCFNKPTLLGCHNPPNRILRSTFDSREAQGLLKKRSRLPNKYLAKIAPCARGNWSNKEIAMVLDKKYGIGEQVGDFYGQWR